MIDLWFQFIRYSLDDTLPLPEDIERMDWPGLFRFCQEQAIAGVAFEGVKSHGERLKVPKQVLLQWFALSEQIKQRNMLLNKRCVELTEMLQKDGFRCCILKGQGNAVLYEGRSFALARTPGDIDIFVLPEGNLSIKERRKVVAEYVRKKFPKTRIRYQHIDYPVFPDVEVEVHFIPTAKNNPIYNKRIQQWAEEEWLKGQGEGLRVELPNGVGSIPVPSVEFNVIYQLSHLMHHFFDEGIGLRQMIDYYFVLRQRENSHQFHSRTQFAYPSPFLYKGRDLEKTLKYLGLWKFAGAVMYIMKEVLGLEEQYLIAPMDERRGKTLLNEILKGGNFGHCSNLAQNNTAKKYFQKIWRNLHFVREYPSEALCEPIFRTWHFFWRLAH